MLGALIAVVVVACACAYLVGYALIAPRDSFLRSTTGGIVLAAAVLVALFGPPVLTGLAGSGSGPFWPDGLDLTAYRALWVASVTLGLLAGVRAWRMRPFGGGGRGFGLDESPVSRAEAMLPLADSLDDALDVLGREKVTARDVPRLAGALKRVGSRFFHQLPERNGDVYALVAKQVPPAVAAEVTGLLLQGAGRKR